MTLSFRTKLLASHILLALVVGAVALFTLDRFLTNDLVRQLDLRMEEQGKGAIEWAEGGRRHPDRITQRIAHIVDAEVTLFEKDGTVIGSSTMEAKTDLGPEIAAAQRGEVGRAARWRNGEEYHYIAVAGEDGTILRLAQPLSEINQTVRETRRRLLIASSFAIIVALLLGYFASRVASQPLAEMTKTADRLTHGDYDVPIEEGAEDEFGVLRRALKTLAVELKARIGELTDERDHLHRLMTIRRDFVANVSHERRTPVTSIQGYAETLLRKEVNAEKRAQFLEVIYRQSERMGALVEQLLALSELEARGKEDVVRADVEVVAIARHVSETVATKAEKRKVAISVEIPPDLHVVADPEGVERALLNLVDNAVKYGKEGGHVTISGARENGQATITVADDGDGIAAEHLPRLFERFYRVDAGRARNLGGAGLGLAIVKHLIESMDGSITVESKVGDGTKFHVTLPVAALSPQPF